MPYFKLGNEWPIFDWIEVWGVMCFPQDEAKREQFQTIMDYKIYIEFADNNQKVILKEKIKDTVISDLVKIGKELIDKASFDNILKDIDVESIGGHFSGDILTYLFQMIETNNIKEASLHKAKAIVITKYQKCKLFNGSKISLKTYPNKLWSKFKPVAHLWAAWHEITGDSKTDLEAALSFDGKNQLYNGFSLFLAIAEYLRRFGEETKTPRGHKGRRAFVLDPNETWRVPPDYPLPAILSVCHPGLDPWAIKILQDEFPGSAT